MGNLLIFSIVFVFTGCNLIFSLNVDWSERDRLNHKDYQKWFQPFYENSPMPPEIIESDYQQYIKLLNEDKNADLKKKYIDRYAGSYKVMSYQFIDMDNDGIDDWYWSEKYKRLIADDTDLDNDGISNYEDADPFDPEIGIFDLDNDGIPNHLDWDKDGDGVADYLGISMKQVELQSKLFDEHGIIAFNQNSKHDFKSLKAFYDVLNLVFKKVTSKNNGKFFNVRYLVANKGVDGSNALAYYRQHNSQISVLDLGRQDGENPIFPNIIPMNFYATMIHELGHALEDYFNNLEGDEFIFNTFYKDTFSRSGEVWIFKDRPNQDWVDDALDEIRRSIKDNPSEYDYYINSRKKVYNTFRSDLFRKNSIPSQYSLKSPHEHFCESLSAYVLKTMIKNRFKGVDESRMYRSVKRYLDIVEQESGLGVTNIPKSLEEYFEDKLQLGSRLIYDRSYSSGGRMKGRWTFQ